MPCVNWRIFLQWKAHRFCFPPLHTLGVNAHNFSPSLPFFSSRFWGRPQRQLAAGVGFLWHAPDSDRTGWRERKADRGVSVVTACLAWARGGRKALQGGWWMGCESNQRGLAPVDKGKKGLCWFHHETVSRDGLSESSNHWPRHRSSAGRVCFYTDIRVMSTASPPFSELLFLHLKLKPLCLMNY